MDENKITHDVAIVLHSKYSILVDVLDMPLAKRWKVCDIEVQVDEFMHKFKDIYNSINSIGLEWYPYVFELNLHEYGEYFINIEADVSDIEIDNNKCMMGIINFNLAYNDERLPKLEDEETEEDMIDRLINGDPEDDEDRPWEIGNESLW